MSDHGQRDFCCLGLWAEASSPVATARPTSWTARVSVRAVVRGVEVLIDGTGEASPTVAMEGEDRPVEFASCRAAALRFRFLSWTTESQVSNQHQWQTPGLAVEFPHVLHARLERDIEASASEVAVDGWPFTRRLLLRSALALLAVSAADLLACVASWSLSFILRTASLSAALPGKGPSRKAWGRTG